jgi:hypothetical protein
MTQPQKNLTDYLAVATEWHRRGFFTTPVKPMAKHPRLNEYNKKPAKNLSVAMQHAFDYPHDDVGLVSTRGAGHFFWLDIDHQSVEDRIFRATGRRLPKTLTTLSRPVTAPWKKHLCFRQTAYSVSQWRTEMTGIRDFTMPKDADGKVPNLFDVKGVGGGGFVVAAGCWRQIQTDTGVIDEMYTLEDKDAPVIDVPDWLVDWVIKNYRKFRSEDAVRRAAEAGLNRIVQSALTKAETERRAVAFEYDPAKDVLSIDAKGGALVPKEYRNGFLKSLGGELATRGIPKALTERMLQVAAEVCEPYTDGDEERDKAIQSVVSHLRIGNVWISRKQIRDAESSSLVTQDASSLVNSLVKPPNRLSVLRDAAKGLPWGSGDLPSHIVNSRLRDAMSLAHLDCGTGVDWKKAVSTALKGIGAKSKKFRSSSGRLIWVWSLMDKQPQDPPLGSTSNVVNFTGGNKDLAAFGPDHSPLQSLRDKQIGRQEGSCN